MTSDEKNQNYIIDSKIILNNNRYIFADKTINRIKTKLEVEDNK
jgi:hypothetical protein